MRCPSGHGDTCCGAAWHAGSAACCCGTCADRSRSGARRARVGRLSSLRHWHWWLLRSWLVRAAAGHSIVLMRAQRRPYGPSRAAGRSPDAQPNPRSGPPRALRRGDRNGRAHPVPASVGSQSRARKGEPPASRTTRPPVTPACGSPDTSTKPVASGSIQPRPPVRQPFAGLSPLRTSSCRSPPDDT